jgi:hypothetical protein
VVLNRKDVAKQEHADRGQGFISIESRTEATEDFLACIWPAKGNHDIASVPETTAWGKELQLCSRAEGRLHFAAPKRPKLQSSRLTDQTRHFGPNLQSKLRTDTSSVVWLDAVW